MYVTVTQLNIPIISSFTSKSENKILTLHYNFYIFTHFQGISIEDRAEKWFDWWLFYLLIYSQLHLP